MTRDGGNVYISQDILVYELRLNSAILVLGERDSSKHAIAIKPMGVTTKLPIDQWISPVANVLTSGQLCWKGAGVCARTEGLDAVNRGEIAREIAKMIYQPYISAAW